MMQGMLVSGIICVDTVALISSIALAFDLGIECHLHTQAEVAALTRYQNYSHAAIAVILGSYIWWCIPAFSTLRLTLRAAHGLIADVCIVSFSLALYKPSRPSIVQLTLITINTSTNLVALVYHTVLSQIFARYLLTVWLATFQDDWSWKTHNKRGWTFLKFCGVSTPDTFFEGWLVYLARHRKRYDRFAKLFNVQVDDDACPYCLQRESHNSIATGWSWIDNSSRRCVTKHQASR